MCNCVCTCEGEESGMCVQLGRDLGRNRVLGEGRGRKGCVLCVMVRVGQIVQG